MDKTEVKENDSRDPSYNKELQNEISEDYNQDGDNRAETRSEGGPDKQVNEDEGKFGESIVKRLPNIERDLNKPELSNVGDDDDIIFHGENSLTQAKEKLRKSFQITFRR